MKKSTGKKIFDVCNYTFLALCIFTTLYPFLNQIALSFTSTKALLRYDITIFPIDPTLKTYEELMSDIVFWNNYGNTLIITFFGTLFGLTFTTMTAYALSKRDLYGKNVIMKLIVFTMFFAGGMIPNFLIMRNLHLLNTLAAVIIPNLIIPYHILIMRTYFMGLPIELEEAAKMDGMGQFGYFIKMALPLSKPIMATMLLFIAVVYWNDWFAAMLYLPKGEGRPVTLYLRNVLNGAVAPPKPGENMSDRTVSTSIQAASMLVVITPVMCIYPFVQKHFVTGVMIGAVKG